MDMEKYMIGIDPGISGGVAIYAPDKMEMLDVMKMPVLTTVRKGKKDVDGGELYKMLWAWCCKSARISCTIELVSGRPGQMGQFQFGMNVGVVYGVLASLSIPVCSLASNKWKLAYGLKREAQETVTEYKKRSIQLAKHRFPNIKFGNSDGLAEAALIAFYGAHS